MCVVLLTSCLAQLGLYARHARRRHKVPLYVIGQAPFLSSSGGGHPLLRHTIVLAGRRAHYITRGVQKEKRKGKRRRVVIIRDLC